MYTGTDAEGCAGVVVVGGGDGGGTISSGGGGVEGARTVIFD